jgi:1-phosphofructokinase family hexose kinase
MVTTVTLNPMLDKTIYLDRIRLGKITRATKREIVPGGKGINVARQLARFGVEAVATGFMGGEIGAIVERLLDEEKLNHDFVRTSDGIREGLTFFEESTQRITGIFEPSQRVSPAEENLLKRKCESLFPKSEWAVFSGSTPTAELDNFYREMIPIAKTAACKVVLDSYGAAFKAGLEAMPFMVKPNLREYELSFGVRLNSQRDILKQLERLEDSGVSLTVLTDTEKPFYASYEGQRWRITPPSVKTVNPTGSGDSFVAATIYGFLQKWEIERTLRFATAAGAVNASRWAVVNVLLSEAEELSPKVRLRAI